MSPMLMKTIAKPELGMLYDLSELKAGKIHPAVVDFLHECILYLEDKNDGSNLQDLYDDAVDYAYGENNMSFMFLKSIIMAVKNKTTMFLIALGTLRNKLGVKGQ